MTLQVKSTGLVKVKTLIELSDILVSYSPLRDEICPAEFLAIKNFGGRVVTVPNKNFPDPFDYAIWLKEYCGQHKTTVLIPGQNFDLFGTRYGRGSGWYDRLLSRLPDDWPRIGLALSNQVSYSRLRRGRHDEPVDWLICQTNDGWRVFEIEADTNPARDP